MEVKNEIIRWQKEIGLSTLELGPKGEIEYAMNIHGGDLSELSIVQMDEVMSILANYLLFIAHQMGLIYARVKYLESRGPKGKLLIERAKLNIIKPVHDAIRVKIDLLKKIYDRRVKENLYATGNRR